MAISIEDWKKIDPGMVAEIILGLLATVSPGLLVLALYRPDLIRELDAVKLVLLSFSLTLPVLVVNNVAIVLTAPHRSRVRVMFVVAMLITFVMLYASVVAAWILHLSFKQLLLLLAALELLAFLAMVPISRDLKRRAARKAPVSGGAG